MSLLLTAEQEELRSSLRGFFSRTSPMAKVRDVLAGDLGYDEAMWKRMSTELGLTGLAIPECYGGSGFGTAELSIVCEELGRALVPGPFLTSAAQAATLLLELGDEAIASELLPAIASGELICTVVHPNDHSAAATARPDESGWTLDGTAGNALDGHAAGRLLVVADRDGQPAVFVVDSAAPGVEMTALRGLDLTRRQSRVTMRKVIARLVYSDDVPGALARTRDRTWVALAAEQLGVLRQCVDMTVAYVKQRVQFGRPVGSFQAVKHGCAGMWVRYELAESAVRAAAAAADEASGSLPELAALARAYVSGAAVETAADMVQYHGGIAYTWEHEAHLYYRRAHSSAVLLGDRHAQRTRLGELLGLTG